MLHGDVGIVCDVQRLGKGMMIEEHLDRFRLSFEIDSRNTFGGFSGLTFAHQRKLDGTLIL